MGHIAHFHSRQIPDPALWRTRHDSVTVFACTFQNSDKGLTNIHQDPHGKSYRPSPQHRYTESLKPYQYMIVRLSLNTGKMRTRLRRLHNRALHIQVHRNTQSHPLHACMILPRFGMGWTNTRQHQHHKHPHYSRCRPLHNRFEMHTGIDHLQSPEHSDTKSH